MKRTILSIIHVLLAAAAFMLFASTAKADNIKVEIVPYRLVPANDVYCQINGAAGYYTHCSYDYIGWANFRPDQFYFSSSSG